MAGWQDGPEFAPRDRPSAFAAPRAQALPAPEPTSSPAEGAPVERPTDFSQPAQPAPALESLVPAVRKTRDPNEPFGVATMTLTRDSSAWGAAHSSVQEASGNARGAGFDPARPLGPVNQPAPAGAPSAAFAPPAPAGTPSSAFAPPSPTATRAPQSSLGGQPGPPVAQGTTPAPPEALSVGAVWRGLTPGVTLGLAFGIILPFISVVAYAIAFAFGLRVQRGQPGVRVTLSIGMGTIVMGGIVVALITGNDFAAWWMTLGRFTELISILSLVGCVIAVSRSFASQTQRTPF